MTGDVPPLRVYFNVRGELPWSVDSGPGTEEFLFRQILDLCGGRYVFDDHGQNREKEPVAWVEYPDARLFRTGEGGLIGVIHGGL